MAVLALKTLEQADDYRGKSINDHSKLRVQYANLPAVVVAGDIGTTIELCQLPPGPVRIIPELSRLKVSAFGAARTLSIGHKAYIKGDSGTTEEAESANALANALDVSAAVTVKLGASLHYDMYSKDGIVVFATVAGGTIPVGATVELMLAYSYE